jgi:hypothetical protein
MQTWRRKPLRQSPPAPTCAAGMQSIPTRRPRWPRHVAIRSAAGPRGECSPPALAACGADGRDIASTYARRPVCLGGAAHAAAPGTADAEPPASPLHLPAGPARLRPRRSPQSVATLTRGRRRRPSLRSTRWAARRPRSRIPAAGGWSRHAARCPSTACLACWAATAAPTTRRPRCRAGAGAAPQAPPPARAWRPRRLRPRHLGRWPSASARCNARWSATARS